MDETTKTHRQTTTGNDAQAKDISNSVAHDGWLNVSYMYNKMGEGRTQ